MKNPDAEPRFEDDRLLAACLSIDIADADEPIDFSREPQCLNES